MCEFKNSIKHLFALEAQICNLNMKEIQLIGK